ncbi:hypothetical protein [Polaromonas sp.]|uniref:hypothetical protein n=1 Tax=Polaromonas sp. TaxID=1869339 RepID=UPI003BA92DB8
MTAISRPESLRPTIAVPAKARAAVPETMATIKAATLNMMRILELVIEEGGEIERNLGYGSA